VSSGTVGLVLSWSRSDVVLALYPRAQRQSCSTKNFLQNFGEITTRSSSMDTDRQRVCCCWNLEYGLRGKSLNDGAAGILCVRVAVGN
jgi:hypothetical protein